MLHSLHIRNYALISSLDIDFSHGLTTITGETGAGKSILLGALSLILGQRAESEVLKDKSLKCVVEGLFQIEGAGLDSFFEKNDLDYQNNTVLRREINANGKSRAFINDTPVTLALLKELGVQLVDIHSQHENLDLSNRSFQLKVLDLISENQSLLGKYSRKYKQYRELESEYNRLVEDLNRSRSDMEFFEFQYKQLVDAKLKENEDTDLESEQKIMAHAEELRGNLEKSFDALNGESVSALGMLRDVMALLSRSENFLEKAGELHARVQSTYIELRDVSGEIERLAMDIELDPQRLEMVNARIDQLFNLLQKHRVQSVNELIKIKSELEQRISNISASDDRILILKQEIDDRKVELIDLSEKLSGNRKKNIPTIEKNIAEIMKDLGVPNARFEIRCETVEVFTPSGRDQVGFFFTANKQVEPQEVSKVASGGEISRLMLAIKSLVAKTSSVPTIVFDEIDSGVSGEIANKMGNLIRTMSAHLQVINITHLPQIAAKGLNHLLVYKKDQRDATLTHIRELKQEERIYEIAKMLSGEKVTDIALENAKQLLES